MLLMLWGIVHGWYNLLWLLLLMFCLILFFGSCAGLGVVQTVLPMCLQNGLSFIYLGVHWIFVLAPHPLCLSVMRTLLGLFLTSNILLLLSKKKKKRKNKNERRRQIKKRKRNKRETLGYVIKSLLIDPTNFSKMHKYNSQSFEL